jgi:hypothetical protein
MATRGSLAVLAALLALASVTCASGARVPQLSALQARQEEARIKALVRTAAKSAAVRSPNAT